MEEELPIEPAPPTAELVAQRAVVLSVVSCRGVVDSDEENAAGAANLAVRSVNWLKTCGLENKLTNWEREILNAPFGTLSQQDRINASWLSEAVAVLAWALCRGEIPNVEEQCDPAQAANSLGFLMPVESTVLSKPLLRSPEILREYNEFIYNLHWRVRDYSINKRSYDFEALATKAWGAPILRHGLVIAEKDLSIGGIPISKSDERAWRSVASITQERHRASNWLIGYESEDFYQVTTDT